MPEGQSTNPYQAAMEGAAVAGDIAGAIWGGQDSPDPANLHLVNSAQQNMWNQMAQGLMNGQGDFGFGSNYKQGKSQVQDFMASRGVKMDPGSGAYAGAMGNMTGQALGMDAQARNNYALQLLGTPLQIAQGGGGNFIPGSPSYGQDAGATQRGAERFRTSGYVPHGVGDTGGGYRYGTGGRWS